MNGITTCINGTLQTDDLVLANAGGDPYAYLVGRVLQIVPVGSPEQDTENTTDDVYVDFDSSYSQERITEIEALFSEVYMETRSYVDIPLDSVIMDPAMLIRITDASDRIVDGLLAGSEYAKGYCYSVERAMQLAV